MLASPQITPSPCALSPAPCLLQEQNACQAYVIRREPCPLVIYPPNVLLLHAVKGAAGPQTTRKEKRKRCAKGEDISGMSQGELRALRAKWRRMADPAANAEDQRFQVLVALLLCSHAHAHVVGPLSFVHPLRLSSARGFDEWEGFAVFLGGGRG